MAAIAGLFGGLLALRGRACADGRTRRARNANADHARASHAYALAHADTGANPHADADPHVHADPSADRNADAEPYPIAKPFTHAHRHSAAADRSDAPAGHTDAHPAKVKPSRLRFLSQVSRVDEPDPSPG